MYFDPGTGSLIIQTVVASIAVIGGYFAATKTRLKNLFTKKKDVETDKTEQDDVDDAL